MSAREVLVIWSQLHYPVNQLNSYPGLLLVMAFKLVVLTWLGWLIALWLLVDKGRRRWVPVILAVGIACLGSEGTEGAIMFTLQLLVYGNLKP
jgi:hypothetical protein